MNKKPVIILLISAAILLAASLLFFCTDSGIVAFKRLTTFNHFVISGESGWLFYRGDLDYALLPWSDAAKNLAKIDFLAKRNSATLIIIPVPNKIDLYPELLDKRIKNGFPLLKEKTDRLFLHLEEQNVAVINLYDTYRNARDIMPLYDPDEAHVTSFGIRLAAKEVVRSFFPQYSDSGEGCLQYKQIPFAGNLALTKDENAPKRDINICFNFCDNAAPSAAERSAGSWGTPLSAGCSASFAFGKGSRTPQRPRWNKESPYFFILLSTLIA